MTAQNYRILYRLVQSLSPTLKNCVPFAYWKALSNKIMIKIKLVDIIWSLIVPVIIYLSATVHESSPQKKNINSDIHPLSIFVIWFFTEIVSLEIVYSLTMYQHKYVYCPTLTDAHLASTSDV
jgi:hypothetical protein